MIFVWSTRLKPILTPCARTACRTFTTSSPVRIGAVSDVSMTKRVLPAIDKFADHGEALVDVEGRAYAGEGQSELHQRDRDRRPHPDDHGDGIEHARHGG